MNNETIMKPSDKTKQGSQQFGELLTQYIPCLVLLRFIRWFHLKIVAEYRTRPLTERCQVQPGLETKRKTFL